MACLLVLKSEEKNVQVQRDVRFVLMPAYQLLESLGKLFVLSLPSPVDLLLSLTVLYFLLRLFILSRQFFAVFSPEKALISTLSLFTLSAILLCPMCPLYTILCPYPGLEIGRTVPSMKLKQLFRGDPFLEMVTAYCWRATELSTFLFHSFTRWQWLS